MMRSTRTARQRRRLLYEAKLKAGKALPGGTGYKRFVRSRHRLRARLGEKPSPAERMFAKLIGITGGIAGKQSARSTFGRVHLQHPILEYFADFCFFRAKLVVEIDGSHHEKPENIEYDRRRDLRMREAGWRVLRIPARRVFRESEAVIQLVSEWMLTDAPGARSL